MTSEYGGGATRTNRQADYSWQNLRNTYSRLEYFSTSPVELLTKVFMKNFLRVGLIAGMLAAVAPVQAGGHFSFHLGLPIPSVSVHIGSPRPVYAHPAPVYVAPPVYLPPRVVVAPPPLYFAPPPIYVPRRVVVAPRPIKVCRRH